MYKNRKTEPALAPIGVFDSGVGGLTVVREIMRQTPSERIVYFGDTARVPYGSKSKNTILRYSRQIIRFLRTQNVKAIVVACNTASALALPDIQKELDIPIIGVVQPGAKVAAETTRQKKVGIIGTEATVNSAIYTHMIQAVDPDIQVISRACPLFTPLVEEGWLKDPVTEQVAARYLDTFKESDIDTLILGCTHYPLLRSLIGRLMGNSVQLVNPAYETASALKNLIEQEDLCNPIPPQLQNDMYQFYVSDAADKFKQFANSILPYDIETTKQINIEEY
ncbi:MAG: glutamate racemase [Lachnospiraceae bacterium]|nr:glutamate racemase [Lachnospiraceae bacterium]